MYRSNWERYFKNIVQVENEHFRKQWEDLYQLRCKIAHNNMFTKENYNKVESIIDELKPSILKAINELDKIKVDDDAVRERVSENFAILNKEFLGEFLMEYNKLLSLMRDLVYTYGLEVKVVDLRKSNNSTVMKDLYLLMDQKIISEEEYRKTKVIIYRRNYLVHRTNIEEEHELKTNIVDIKEIIASFSEKLNLKRREKNEEE